MARSKKKSNLERKRSKIRKVISGTSKHPRLAVYRSLSHIYVQAIDDTTGKTLASASSLKLKTKGKKADLAKAVGQAIAVQLQKMGIDKVSFDRGGKIYHGRIKAIAEGAREKGLIF